MAHLNHITFTGVDYKTDFIELQKIQKRLPQVEFGVLTSYHWHENGNRYLPPALFRYLGGFGLNLSLHLCGQAAIDAAAGEWNRIDILTFGCLDMFNRIQLNIVGKNINPACVRKPKYEGQEVIVQTSDLDGITPYETARSLSGKCFSFLLDKSGGRGIDTPVEAYRSSHKIGYAGGINSNNVGDKLRKLLASPDAGEFWIDMESGVRTEDWMDLEKVVMVVEQCESVLLEQ